MANVALKIKQGKADLPKQKVTVTSVAVAPKKFLSCMCDCKVDSNVCWNRRFSLVLEILHT